jgi:hypothetical protein
LTDDILKSIENHLVEIFVIVVRLKLISIDYELIVNNYGDLIDRISRLYLIFFVINKNWLVDLL